MARRKKVKITLRSLIALLVLFAVAVTAVFVLDALNVIDKDELFAAIFGEDSSGLDGEDSSGLDGEDSSGLDGEIPVAAGNLNVHIIDVGQADCILLMTENANMLIDTGDLDDDYTTKILNYLKAQGVSELEYLVLTHPDADHIGGAPEVIREFKVKNCILPDCVKDTKIYENTITALEEEEVNVIEGKTGYTFEFADTLCNVLAPVEKTNEANNASVVIKLTHGENTFLFTGDAEKESEELMLDKYSASDLDCDFLKSGHHGSSSSSTQPFLNAVTPTYAVMSCGEGNKYGHPHTETIEKYEAMGIEYYRTDIHGTVVVISDGTTITISTEKK